MILIKKEIRIRFLLKEGVSERRIAREVKVARQTVKLIRESPGLRPRKIRKIKQPFERLRTPHRCPDCGGRVIFWPCLLCNPEIGE